MLSTVTVLVSVATMEPRIAHHGNERPPSRYDSTSLLFRPDQKPTTIAASSSELRTTMSTMPRSALTLINSLKFQSCNLSASVTILYTNVSAFARNTPGSHSVPPPEQTFPKQ